MRNRSWIWALVIILALASGLAACGGGDEPTPAPAAAAANTQPPAPTATQPPAPTATAKPAASADEHVQRGIELGQEGKLAEAIAEFQAALDLDPDSALAHGNLGAIYARQDKIPQAIAEMEQAIALDPDYLRSHANLCHLYNTQGQTEQAFAACEKALALDPTDSRALTNLGVLYLDAQDYEQAISILTQALDSDPENTLALNDLGHAYTKVGDLEAAIDTLQEALRLDPRHVGAMLNLGLAYVQLGDFTSAIAQYQKAIGTQPDYPDPHLNLAIVYRTLGQLGTAADEFETFLQLAPTSPQAAAVENEVARLRQIEDSLSAEYYDGFGNFRLRYPAGWAYQASSSPGTVLFSPDPQGMVGPFFGVFSVPLIEHDNGIDLSGVTTAEELLAGTAEQYHVDPAQMNAFPLAGQTALVGDWQQTLGGEQYVGKIAFLVDQGLGYVITSIALPDEWSDFEMTGLGMVGSLTMAAPEVSAEYSRGVYSLRYPAGWVAQEKEMLTTFTPLEDLYPQESPYVAVFAGQDNIVEGFQVEGAFDADTIAAAFVQLLDASADPPETRTVGDHTATAVDFTAVQDGVDIAGVLLLFLDEPEPMAVLGAAPAPRWPSFVETFVEMMASLDTSGAAQAGAGAGIDMEDPASVLQAVFDAARTGDFSTLAGLCDPQGQNDDDTALICAITADHPDRDSFVAYFAAGKVAGEAVVQGDRAEVPFLFGPNGDQEETMVLVRRDGKWYLAEF